MELGEEAAVEMFKGGIRVILWATICSACSRSSLVPEILNRFWDGPLERANNGASNVGCWSFNKPGEYLAIIFMEEFSMILSIWLLGWVAVDNLGMAV